MLTINKKSKKKGVVTFTHKGYDSTINFSVKVNDSQKSFIEKNINNIHFDITNTMLYMRNYTPANVKSAKPIKKITLSKAMFLEETGKMPKTNCKSLSLIK